MQLFNKAGQDALDKRRNDKIVPVFLGERLIINDVVRFSSQQIRSLL